MKRRPKTSSGFYQNPSSRFDHFLALELGWRTVAEMRRGMSAREWRRWLTWYRLKWQEEKLEALKAQARARQGG